MIESGRGLGLSQQTLLGALIGSDFCWEELNRHFAAEPLVLSQVDLAHTAAPELLDDAVVRDGLADHGLADHLWPSIVWPSIVWPSIGANLTSVKHASQ